MRLLKHALLGRGKHRKGAARKGGESWEAVVAEANSLTNCLPNSLPLSAPRPFSAFHVPAARASAAAFPHPFPSLHKP